jgi:hypothetical protein
LIIDWLQWGTVPDWFMVVVTGVGLGATFFLIRHEVERRREEQTERMQDQAMKVGASSEIHWRKTPHPEVTVTNGSDAPIYNAVVTVSTLSDQGEAASSSELGMIHPGTHRSFIALRELGEVTNTLIEFTDGANHRWSRSSQGVFKDLGVVEYAEPPPST